MHAILTEDLGHVEESLLPLVTALRERRILLTGGTGFFGKWLLYTFVRLREACGCPASLTVLSRDPARFLAMNKAFVGVPGLSFIAGDIRTFEPPCGQMYDTVIHGATAASAALDRDRPDEMSSVIVDGTHHLLATLRPCGVRRLLYLSSGAVYGLQPAELSQVPESYEGSPTTAYGKAKKHAERLCLAAASGRFECVIARPFAFVGPFLPLDIHYAAGNFIRDALANRPILVAGDGRPCRSYLYAADLAVWLWTLLLRGRDQTAYNVGSSEAVSIAELARIVSSTQGTQSTVVISQKPDVSAPAPRYVPDTRLAEQSLGLRRRYALPDAVARTMRFVATGDNAY